MSDSPNRDLLDEVNRAGLWFTAKKVAHIRARLVDVSETVQSLEGEEQINAGDYLCQGVAGEFWPQSASALNAKYIPEGDVDDKGWRNYVPNPKTSRVMAAQIAHPFTVTASWGNLSGKSGDYLLKHDDDKDVVYPEDIWIVDLQLFQATYETL